MKNFPTLAGDKERKPNDPIRVRTNTVFNGFKAKQQAKLDIKRSIVFVALIINNLRPLKIEKLKRILMKIPQRKKRKQDKLR